MNTQAENPGWDGLYALAAEQSGFFTTAQAATAGYSKQRLQRHLAAGRIERARRGIYRLRHFPMGEHDELVVVWLWSDHQGAFSNETALALHQLSDVLPSHLHLTVPASWAQRRLRVPSGLQLYYADLTDADTTWFDSMPITTPERTLADCIETHLSLEHIERAMVEAKTRGLISSKAYQSFARRIRERKGNDQ